MEVMPDSSKGAAEVTPDSGRELSKRARVGSRAVGRGRLLPIFVEFGLLDRIVGVSPCHFQERTWCVVLTRT